MLNLSRHLSVCEKMCSWISFPSLVAVVLRIAFIAVSNDLAPSITGVQAWTYSYTTKPTLDYESARRYCREHFTDIVAIQNQAEISYLNQLLPRIPDYYWIGIRKLQGRWTWVGTQKVLTPEAENWATGEPNDLGDLGEDCVEMYIKREADTAKWNDANCKKKKGAICYTASCLEDSCSDHAECEETIGDFRCKCQPGFEGPRCENAVACGPVQALESGSVRCVHVFGENRYNSSCQLHCNPGFQLLGATQILCLATGQWEQHTSLCKAVECPAVSKAPSGGRVNCSHPIAPHSLNSTCEFRCDEGFLLQGAQRIECGPTGQWTHSAPTCTVVTCEPLWPPSGGAFTCESPLGHSSYNSTCNFSCKVGHTLTGVSSLTCLPSGNWSAAAPVCEVVHCGQLNSPHYGKLKCADPLEKFSYNSTCWSECDSGFILKGNNFTHCSAQGQWSHSLPVCQAVECPAISDAPSGGRVNCSHPIAPHSFNSTCEFRCDEGFLLQGAQRIECEPTGQWTHSAPTCTVVKCEQLKAPSHGKLKCLDPFEKFSYNSTCWSKCDSGFVLKGRNSAHCSAQGQWNHSLPACQAMECPAISDPPSGGRVNCSHPIAPHSLNSTCEFRCDEGFLLQGAQRIECEPTGQWTHSAPTCTAVGCEQLKAPSNGKLKCLDPFEKFSYNSTCWSECDSGFILEGGNSTHCSTQGQWSHALPVCHAVQCPTMSSAPGDLTVNCSHPFALHSFTSTCEFRCDEGYVLQGPGRIECDYTGQWTSEAPSCKVREKPLGAALLMYAAIGAGSALGLLGMVAAIVLVQRLTKKAQHDMDESLWNSNVNPVFEDS